MTAEADFTAIYLRIVGFDLLFDAMSLLKSDVYMRNGWLGCAVMPLVFALGLERLHL